MDINPFQEVSIMTADDLAMPEGGASWGVVLSFQYRKISNMSRTKSQNLNDSSLVL